MGKLLWVSRLGLSLALPLTLAAGRLHAGIAQWELEGDLASSTGGDPISLDAAMPAAEADLSFETAIIGGEEAIVARFSRGTLLRLPHGLAPNGGGRFLNRYTIVVDVLFADRSPSGGWAALVQTDPDNATDGDWFVNPAAGLGISGQYAGVVEDGVWHRLGLAVDLVAGTLTSYIDGERVNQLAGLTVDSRFSVTGEVLLFADENAENAAGWVASVQVRDEALDDLGMAYLGCPSAGGIPRTTPPPPEPVALWTFNDPGNPLRADVGSDLVLVGSHSTVEGTTPADGAVRIGPGSFYRAWHGIAPPQGAYVNEYSIAYDFRVPSIGPWYCFFQTNQSNQNDGDCFVRTDGALGVGATGYTSTKISPEVWYRMVVAVDNARGRYDIYLDGDLVLDGTPQEVDGRFSLDPTILLFADENGEDGSIDVAQVAMWDRALGTSEAHRLGGPGTFDPDNRAPRVLVAPAGPDTVDAQVPAGFEFRADDEDGDLVQLRIAWGDGTTEEWGPASASGALYAVTHSFRRTGILEILVQARDEHGSLSEWTRVQYVRVTGEVDASFLTEPFLQNLTADGISVLWELDTLAAAQLEYGPDPSYGESIDVEPADTGYLSYVYRARLRGLAPGEYHYRVVATGLPGDDRTFRIPPPDGESFSFAVWGDSQGTNHGTYPADPYEPTRSMMVDIGAGGHDFAVAVGDLAESGTDYSGVHAYYLERVATGVGRTTPWFVAWGNHDEGRSAVIRKFADLPSAERPGFDPGWGSFSFDHAGCHFVCLDYDTFHTDIQSGWLEADLAEAAARDPRFTFLFVHVPPFCEIWIDGDAWLRAYLVPLLERYGVDVCFSGHTHEYERGTLRGTSYVITGGGSWLDFPEPYTTNWPHMIVGGYHSIGGGVDKGLVNEYVRVHVDGDTTTLEMVAFHADGSPMGILDTFSIERCGNGNGDVTGECVAGGQIPGDANQDGRLDLSDPVWLLDHLFLGSGSVLPCEGGTAESPGSGELILLDSNGDTRLDISDAVGFLTYLFLGGAPPALGADCVPIPGCPSTCR